MRISKLVCSAALFMLFTMLFHFNVPVITPAAAIPQSTVPNPVSWKITNTFNGYTSHGKISAGMDYLYEGNLQTSPSGKMTVNLLNFNPTNLQYEPQGGAGCTDASFVVICTGILTRLHITFNYNAGAVWVDPFFSNTSDFNNTPAMDMTYKVVYSNQFIYVSADPTPTSSAPGQVTWFAANSNTIAGKVQFINPFLLPKKFYLPVIIR